MTAIGRCSVCHALVDKGSSDLDCDHGAAVVLEQNDPSPWRCTAVVEPAGRRCANVRLDGTDRCLLHARTQEPQGETRAST